MTDWAMQSISGNPQILSKRLGDYMRRQASAKELALLIDCDQRTAENIRAGRTWPIARHWFNIWVEFGEDVLEAVFMPERVEQRLKREAEEREQARRTRLASSLVESRTFGLGAGLGRAPGEGEGLADEALEPGPDNLDLFEARR